MEREGPPGAGPTGRVRFHAAISVALNLLALVSGLGSAVVFLLPRIQRMGHEGIAYVFFLAPLASLGVLARAALHLVGL